MNLSHPPVVHARIARFLCRCLWSALPLPHARDPPIWSARRSGNRIAGGEQN
jgi:hypothetical protein